MSPAVIVTGGAGYIGSHACKALAVAGFLPITIDDLSNGHRWAVKWGPLFEGRIDDDDLLARVVHDHGPVAVMHFAGLIAVGESIQKPELYHWFNVDCARSMFDALFAHGIRNVVFSSSAAVYGQPKETPISESHPRQPLNPYGENKRDIEDYLRSMSATGTASINLRYFNAAGADPDGEIGEAHDPETHLIPLALEVAQGVREYIDIFGDDYPTGDGTCVRDYVHVTDLAAAHVRALQHLLVGEVSGSLDLNLGCGTGYSVLEVIDSVRRVTGKQISTRAMPRRLGDPAHLVASNDLARRRIGWQPRGNSLDRIVADAWRWQQAYSASRRVAK